MCEYDELEQYYYVDGKFIENKREKYALYIGNYLISFSELENELNLAIADIMFEDDHNVGFSFITELSISQKIIFFFQRCALTEAKIDTPNKTLLNNIRNNFRSVIQFRNTIAHANWQSLTVKNYLHTKIKLDTEDGVIKFKKVKITPSIINSEIKKIEKLISAIEKYKEDLRTRCGL